ncbi:MAG: histidine phosphatase family protein [Chloroherpetonaceae bacterium]|nr:histidine phosphatase family protein [Chloroherpetonaceae bacterium]
MKQLYLIRHAKSSWSHPELTDFERPLNKRGRRDAPVMGSLLKEKGIKFSSFISSPATRAIMTAKLIADAVGYAVDDIITDIQIYDAPTNKLLSIVQSFPDQFETIALFGHNPAMTELPELLTGKSLENVPTCGVVGIRFPALTWQTVKEKSGELFLFEYPKKYLKSDD